MTEPFDGRLRQLLHDTARLAGEPGTLPETVRTAPIRSGPGRVAFRVAAAAGAAAAVLAVGYLAVNRPRSPDLAVPVASATSVAGVACPATPPTGKVSAGPEPAGPFVAGTPSGVAVCAYGRGGVPTHGAVLAAARADQVIALLNALPAATRGFRSCPLDDGSAYVVIVHGATEQLIVVERTGCRTAGDGSHLRQADDELLGALATP